MIALDTNVLLRVLLRDAPEQFERALALLTAAAATGESVFISDIVLCETVWVLTRAHHTPRAVIEATVRALIETPQYAFTARERVASALDAFSRGSGDFADYLIREHARAAGCRDVATFDRALLADDGFRSP